MVTYTDDERQIISAQAEGKTIEIMEWVADGQYWIIGFTDGTEVAVRLMAEISDQETTRPAGACPEEHE